MTASALTPNGTKVSMGKNSTVPLRNRVPVRWRKANSTAFMDLQLKGKRALITGSSAGIGYAIAEALAMEGASVIVNGRTTQRVEAALVRLNHSGIGKLASGLAADLGTAEGAQMAR